MNKTIKFIIRMAIAVAVSVSVELCFSTTAGVITLLVWVSLDYYLFDVILKYGSAQFFLACNKYPALAVWYFTYHDDCFLVFYDGEPIHRPDKSWSGPYKLHVQNHRCGTTDMVRFFTKEPDCERLEKEFAAIADDLAKCMNKVWEWVATLSDVAVDPDSVAMKGYEKLTEMYLSLLKEKGIATEPFVGVDDTEDRIYPLMKIGAGIKATINPSDE